MTPVVVAAVLTAAVLHASWNALAKLAGDRRQLFGRLGAVTALLSFPALLWVPLPAPRSWYWLLASVAVHLVYSYALMAAYHVGDFSQTYPIARGLGPLVVAGVAVLALGEPMAAITTAGVVLVAGAVALLGLLPWRRVRANRAAVATAVLTGLAIAGYTLIDGIGVRRSDSPLGYTLWLTGLQGMVLWLVMVVAARARSGRTASDAEPAARPSWFFAGTVAVLSIGAYGLVLWAQTRGALAGVAALRESSVVVAAGIGTVFFGEPMGRLRVVCSAAVAVGAVLLALPA